MPAAVRAGAPPRDRWREDPRLRHWFDILGPAALILVAQAVFFRRGPFEAPGLYLFGAVMGLLSALVAMGMALIYRANRILNFAQSELGLVPTAFAFCLMAYAGFPYPIALVIGLIGSLVVGGFVQTVIIERFTNSPRLILTVATIGLAQLLTLLTMAIPALWGEQPVSQRPIAPFGFSFDLAPITFGSGHVLALLVAPVVLAAVSFFLRYSNAGIAIRAAAERADRAELLGIPVARLNGLVWSIAALLSFTGVFLRGSITGIPFSTVEGFGSTSFTTLMAALTALTLGRFTNLPAIAFSAVALGIAEQQLLYTYGSKPALVYPMYGLVILVALGVRRVGQSRAEQDSVASWQAADEIRPIPLELRRNPEVLVVKWGGLGLLAFIAWRIPTLPFMEPSRMLLLTGVVVFAIVGVSIIMLTGWAGLVTLGQMGFVAVGAAVGAYATREWDLDLSIALVIAGVAGAVAAVIVGLPALRAKGLFLGVTTLAFATTAAFFLFNPTYFSWIPTGRIERPMLFATFDLNSPATMYQACLGMLVLVILAVTGLRRSRTGRVLMALRENERGAQAYGINTTRVKLTGFALSGFCAALAGCLYVHVIRTFTVTSFSAGESFSVFTATVVGGLGGQTGAILGAIYARGGTWFLQGSWQLLPTAVGVMLVLLILPGGFSGLVFRVRDRWLRSVARRFEIVVPSLMADTGIDEFSIVSQAEARVEDVAAAHPGDRSVTGEPDLTARLTAGPVEEDALGVYASAREIGLEPPTAPVPAVLPDDAPVAGAEPGSPVPSEPPAASAAEPASDPEPDADADADEVFQPSEPTDPVGPVVDPEVWRAPLPHRARAEELATVNGTGDSVVHIPDPPVPVAPEAVAPAPVEPTATTGRDQ